MATGKNPVNPPISDHRVTNRLAHAPIGQLLRHYALPAVIGTLVVSLYNIVDRIFIGHGVGSEAISGLALTFPIMTLSIACGMLVGTGGGARISILLGKGDREQACHVLGNCLLLNIGIGLVYSVTNYYWMDDILFAFGGSKKTLPYAREYLQVIVPFALLSNLSFSFNNMMRSSGYPRKAMYTMIISAVANIILDALFIFVFDLGIRGAAIATVLAMSITAVWVMVHYLQPKHEVHFTRASLRLNRRVVWSIVTIGLSPFLINLTASLVNVILNKSLLTYGGDLAIGAYGIINSYITLVVMLVIGTSQGMQPIVGYNYGAQHYDRVIEAFKKTVLLATAITTVGSLIAQCFPGAVTGAFTHDAELMAIATNGLHIILVAFPIVGFQIVTTSLFQSIGQASIAVFLSLSRQVLLLLPLIWFLPRLLQLNGVWGASPIADTLSALLAASMLAHRYYRLKHRKA